MTPRYTTLPVTTLLALLITAAPLLADTRSDFLAARKTLARASYDELGVRERDELFRQIAGYDSRDAPKAVAEVVGRFGLHLDVIEAKMAQTREKLGPLMNTTAMTDQRIALRNIYLRRIKNLETDWRDSIGSLDHLTTAMGTWQDKKTLDLAIAYLPKQSTWRVREVTALACAKWHKSVQDEKSTIKLFRTLELLAKDKEPRVRRAVARALYSFKRAEAAPVLKRCLNDEDWHVRGAAIESVRRTPTNQSVDMLIGRLKKEKGRLEDDINKALQEITGQKYRWPDQWEGWWKGNGRRLPPKGASTDPNAPDDPKKKRKIDHKFYGIRSRSDRIVYIIDMSGSMKKEVEETRQGPITGTKKSETPVGGRTRWQVASNELKRALRNLHRKAHFQIIFFNNSVQPWRDGMILATKENKKAAIEFVDKVKPRGATYTLGALRKAFGMAGAEISKGSTKGSGPTLDTIFLLSDGGPTDAKMSGASPMDPDPILAQVAQWNKGLGVVIHTIAVHTDEVGTYFLKQLAAQNKGQFVHRK